MDKNQLEELLKKGLSHRKIANELGIAKSNVGYWINKLNLNHLNNYTQLVAFKLGKIDNPELAYLIGFMCGDGCLGNDGKFDISVSILDKEVLYRMRDYFDGNVFESDKFDAHKRIFPKARYGRKIIGLSTVFGGRLKEGRNIPIISKELNRYLILGFFDAEGCITWGRRKDRNRIWHKVSFTSSLSMLTTIQQLLIKECSISTIVRQKSNENCYVLEFANKKDINTFYEYLYSDDFNSLNRKRTNYEALRLELGEFGETANAQYRAEPTE